MKKLNKNNKGFFILEALIAILIFMVGILGIMQLQVIQMQATADAQYRTQASYMAENIMSQIVIDKGNVDTFVDGSNPNYSNWLGDLQTILPGVENNPPTITSNPAASGGILITIVIKWKAPQSEQISNYTLKSVII